MKFLTLELCEVMKTPNPYVIILMTDSALWGLYRIHPSCKYFSSNNFGNPVTLRGFILLNLPSHPKLKKKYFVIIEIGGRKIEILFFI